MNGMKPRFLVGTVSEKYYEVPNPYETAPSCNVNLLELSRYAKRIGKELVDLSHEEVMSFAK